mgnify:CR=1 FL=1
MINSLIEVLEGFDPLFGFVLTYKWIVTACLFSLLFVLTKNVYALIITAQIIIAKFIYLVIGDTELLKSTSQFIVICLSIFICRKNPLIALSYLILAVYFFLEYSSNSIKFLSYQYDLEGTLISYSDQAYNNAVLVYYSYFALLPLVLYLMIKGLFSDWGKGRESGRYRNYIGNDGVDGFNNFMSDDYHSRFKRLFKKSNQRV